MLCVQEEVNGRLRVFFVFDDDDRVKMGLACLL